MKAMLRETRGFKAEASARGVRLVAKGSVMPKARVVRRLQDYDRYLAGLPDQSFDAACVLDFGVGVFVKGGRR